MRAEHTAWVTFSNSRIYSASSFRVRPKHGPLMANTVELIKEAPSECQLHVWLGLCHAVLRLLGRNVFESLDLSPPNKERGVIP